VAAAPSLPAGVVFDCDGTIVDTEPVSRDVLREVLPRYGYEPTHADFDAIVGHPGHRTYAYLAERAELPSMEVFRDELRAEWRLRHAAGLVVFTDAVAVIVALTDAGVPVAVASSSSRAHVRRSLEVAGVLDRVVAHLGAEDVRDHKPHPEPYLAAARALGVPPTACSAVEDTATGLAAARAAGMFTVGIVREGRRDHLSGAHRVVDEITVEALRP
jgi:beta-phosphoglucomutase-like phosphatase (HAD superfamily)